MSLRIRLQGQIDEQEVAKAKAEEPIKKEDLIRLTEKKHLTAQEIEALGKAGIIRSPIKGKVTKVALEIGRCRSGR